MPCHAMHRNMSTSCHARTMQLAGPASCRDADAVMHGPCACHWVQEVLGLLTDCVRQLAKAQSAAFDTCLAVLKHIAEVRGVMMGAMQVPHQPHADGGDAGATPAACTQPAARSTAGLRVLQGALARLRAFRGWDRTLHCTLSSHGHHGMSARGAPQIKFYLLMWDIDVSLVESLVSTLLAAVT